MPELKNNRYLQYSRQNKLLYNQCVIYFQCYTVLITLNLMLTRNNCVTQSHLHFRLKSQDLGHLLMLPTSCAYNNVTSSDTHLCFREGRVTQEMLYFSENAFLEC